mmetsp:Transcript_34948/g.108750  ORF Transcript_34948/g.108750 Transcript_34948/m.108750 type:complete len:412 (+) Transcript_34948:67-1302(+)
MANERRTLAVGAIIVFLWLLIGTVVYRVADNCSTDTSCSTTGKKIETEVCGWSIAESFYYAVQAGLSIGFGLLPETADGSRLYTVFHILMGSSIIGGVLALFVSLAVSRHTSKQNKYEERLAKHIATRHLDGYKGMKVDDLRELMVSHPAFYRDVLEYVEGDDANIESKLAAFRQMKDKQRQEVVDALIEEAHQAGNLQGGKVSIDDLQRVRNESRGTGKKMKVYFAQHASFIVVWTLFFIWMLVGIIFGLAAEKWNFIVSLYFAVSTCSTAGLQAVTRDDWHVFFAGVYALIGVPLYGGALGTFANLLVDRYNAKVFADKMNSKLQASDVEFVQHIDGKRGSDVLDQAEFMEVQLLKFGNVDRELLRQLRDQFEKLDTERRGKVSKELLLKGHKRRIERAKKEAQRPDAV